MEDMAAQENKDHFICPFCGGLMYWSNTEMAYDASDDYEGDDLATINYFVCSRCGRDYEIVDPTQIDRETIYSEYWNN